jgi:hypothetical protein
MALPGLVQECAGSPYLNLQRQTAQVDTRRRLEGAGLSHSLIFSQCLQGGALHVTITIWYDNSGGSSTGGTCKMQENLGVFGQPSSYPEVSMEEAGLC